MDSLRLTVSIMIVLALSMFIHTAVHATHEGDFHTVRCLVYRGGLMVMDVASEY